MTGTPVDPEKVALAPRDVRWEWSGLPAHYLDDDPVATHLIDAFHMLLPEGEIFFVQTFQEALAHITDDAVRADVLGFIGQEAVHSSSHQSVLDHFTAQGIDTTPYIRQVRWLFRGLLGDRHLSGKARYSWLVERVAVIAALEHVTSYLGNWGLNATAWDEAMEPRMLDLLRWHLAEEVEHRHVAYDLFTHLDGSYRHRIRAHLVALPTFVFLTARGIRFMCGLDPDAPTGRWKQLRAYLAAAEKKLVPGPRDIAVMAFEYFRPGYHPSHYGSTSQAVAYLASSPAAHAAMVS
ncbi:Predicted metal-dependent hydrolase [Nocardia farcinica]|uniref:Predicted metal-dependent hydrolase n=1 Tax=Nocardia farcinica TaxID=37329 RepID=A0A449GZF5_NOCFR|nr:metal-dependent hydrolase [Nocardia farcinica]VFA91138.1 Predicted metal-dependent hydrolase [Nocardia farcinica]